MTEKLKKVINCLIDKRWINLPMIFPDTPRTDAYVFFIDHVICESNQKPTDYATIRKVAIPAGLGSVYSIVIEITGLSKEETDILFRFKEGEELLFNNTIIEI